MNTAEKTKRFDQRWILVILFVLFALPATLSWFLFNYTDFGRGKGEDSHGETGTIIGIGQRGIIIRLNNHES